ncbi:uncharacterized protein LOC144340155 [Macaca mulatta]
MCAGTVRRCHRTSETMPSDKRDDAIGQARRCRRTSETMPSDKRDDAVGQARRCRRTSETMPSDKRDDAVGQGRCSSDRSRLMHIHYEAIQIFIYLHSSERGNKGNQESAC